MAHVKVADTTKAPTVLYFGTNDTALRTD